MPSETLKRLTTLENAMSQMAVAVTRLSDEMRSFKDEMRSFKDESVHDRRELYRQLGEIANAQGRLVEDIAAPSVPRVLRALLGLQPTAAIAPFAVRARLRHPSDSARMREIDVLAGHDGVILVTEVKSQLSAETVSRLADSLGDIAEYVVPLGAREVLGAVATLYPDPSVVAQATRLGLVVLGTGDDLLEPKNPPGFTPRRVTR